MTYLEARQTALESLERGEAREAFAKFRWTMEYPGQLGDDPARWRDALTVFARIAAVLAGDAFATPVRRAADAPDDVRALYALGYGLIEQDLNGIAATVLARANLLLPNQERLVTELACALERDLRFHEVCRFLRAAPELVEQSFQCRYLLAYNALMTGDLIEPRQMLRGLDPGNDPDRIFMADRIAGMLSRADAVRGVTPLNETGLRGWHFVLTGGLLLHLSPFGFEDAHARAATRSSRMMLAAAWKASGDSPACSKPGWFDRPGSGCFRTRTAPASVSPRPRCWGCRANGGRRAARPSRG
jgi:hypothetical protein